MIWWIVSLAILWLIGIGLHAGVWVHALLIAALMLVVFDAVRHQQRRMVRVPGPEELPGRDEQR